MSVEAQEIPRLPEVDPLEKESIPQAARRKLSSPWASFVVILLTFVWTIPTLGLLITSLRPAADAQNSGWWTFFTNPAVTWSNYSESLRRFDHSGWHHALLQLLRDAIPAAIFPLTIACSAYALAWVRFKWSTVVFFTIFALQVIPLQMSLLPLLQMFNLGWNIGPIPVSRI